MPLKREPDAYPSEGPGGAHHRYDALSKADWADAFASLYREVHGREMTVEHVLDMAEALDDRRRMVAGQRPARRPRPATEAEKAAHRARVAEVVRHHEARRAAQAEARA